jgi:hypothetical protein
MGSKASGLLSGILVPEVLEHRYGACLENDCHSTPKTEIATLASR